MSAYQKTTITVESRAVDVYLQLVSPNIVQAISDKDCTFVEICPYDQDPLVMTLFVELVCTVSYNLTLREESHNVVKITKGVLTGYKRQVFSVRINGKRIHLRVPKRNKKY
jgi:hypothetical protein